MVGTLVLWPQQQCGVERKDPPILKVSLSVCGFAPSLTEAYVTEPQDEGRSQVRVPKWSDFCGAGKDVRRIKYNEMGRKAM
jgi:hypothetical protein